jgi:hypothetical protein
MKYTKLFIGAMLMASAVAANAATPDFTRSLTIVLSNDKGVYSSDFGNTFSGDQKGKTFLDTYTFALNSVSDLDAVVSSIATINRGVTKLDLDITSFGLYFGGEKISSIDPDLYSTGYLDLQTIVGMSNLVSGNYSLQVGGKVLGTMGGSYGGNVNVSPVPEPESWGLMFSGLAAVGFMARRRKSNSSKSDAVAA